jgi:hypothetical protein
MYNMLKYGDMIGLQRPQKGYTSVANLAKYNKLKYINMAGPKGEKAILPNDGRVFVITPDGMFSVQPFKTRLQAMRHLEEGGWRHV